MLRRQSCSSANGAWSFVRSLLLLLAQPAVRCKDEIAARVDVAVIERRDRVLEKRQQRNCYICYSATRNVVFAGGSGRNVGAKFPNVGAHFWRTLAEPGRSGRARTMLGR